LEKLTVPEIIKNFSTFYAPRRFITVFAKARPSQFKPHSCVLVSSYQQSQMIQVVPLLQIAPPKFYVCFWSPPHISHATPICWSVQIMQLHGTPCREASQCSLLYPTVTKRGHVVWCARNCCACGDLLNIQFVTSAMCFRYYRFYFSYEP